MSHKKATVHHSHQGHVSQERKSASNPAHQSLAKNTKLLAGPCLMLRLGYGPPQAGQPRLRSQAQVAPRGEGWGAGRTAAWADTMFRTKGAKAAQRPCAAAAFSKC